jgi:hypothetical protein
MNIRVTGNMGRAGLLSSLALAANIAAQVPAPQQGRAAAGQVTVEDGLTVSANEGQTSDQQRQDRYECHSWAVGQTGFDPSLPGGGVAPAKNAARRSNYQRAMAACLEAHGYTVEMLAPSGPAPPVPPAPEPETPVPLSRQPSTAEEQRAPSPSLNYRPFDVQISAGFSIPAGSTADVLYGGPIAALGLAWFPSPALPAGIRLDGDFNYFMARRRLLQTASGGPYRHGHEAVYGGDADLQLNLQNAPEIRVYVFGGLGEYREHTYLRQVSFGPDTFCSSFFFCESESNTSETSQYTTQWKLAWNAGAGWEVAITPRSTFFIEARFVQILPRDARTQFVPVTVGFRF